MDSNEENIVSPNIASEFQGVDPEVVWRRIKIAIMDEDKDTVFEAVGNVDRKTSHRFLEGVGYAFIPQEPMPRLIPVPARAIGKISCEHDRDCTDYPEKCSRCGENKAKSYFRAKEE